MSRFDRDTRLYARMVLYIVLTVVLTIFFVSTALYVNFENIGQTLIHGFIKDTLSQISYSATLMTGTAKTILSQINTDSSISRFFNPTPLDSYAYNAGLQRLNSFKNSFPFINSICIYNAYTQTYYTDASHIHIYSREDFPDKWAVTAIENPESYSSLVPYPRKLISSYSEEGQPTFVYSYILARNKNTGTKIQNTIILNVSEVWIKSIIQSMDVNPGSNTFIIDSEGFVVSSNDKYEVLSDISDLDYIQEILNSLEASDYYIKNIDGVKTLVTYVASNTTGWRFVRLTPYGTIISRIESMRKMTVIVGLSILLLGILVSIILSRRIYSPIHSMLRELDTLEKEQRNNLLPLKQKFLRSVVQGENEYPGHTLHKKLEEFKIVLDAKGPIHLLLLKIDRYQEFCSSNDTNDRGLLRFAIMNVATEIVTQKYICEAVDMGEDHIVLLVNIPQHSASEYQLELDGLIKNIQAATAEYLSLSISAVVSQAGSSIEDASELYHKARDAAHYILFNGHQAVIHAETLVRNRLKEYTYPLKKEKLLIDALISSREAEAKSIYAEIVHGAKSCSYNTFYMVLVRLAAAVNMAADSIENNSAFTISYDFALFISRLKTLETIHDIDEHFFSMFDYILQKLEEKKNPKYDELIQRIYRIVEQKYRDPNLSRETIADEVGLSSVYLGRLFLKLTSCTIADYICDFRLQKAKEQLAATGLSISDISAQAGFTSPNYFHTLFKKTFGVTPSDYRQSSLRSST